VRGNSFSSTDGSRPVTPAGLTAGMGAGAPTALSAAAVGLGIAGKERDGGGDGARGRDENSMR
jgi:hypothetical protein